MPDHLKRPGNLHVRRQDAAEHCVGTEVLVGQFHGVRTGSFGCALRPSKISELSRELGERAGEQDKPRVGRVGGILDHRNNPSLSKEEALEPLADGVARQLGHAESGDLDRLVED